MATTASAATAPADTSGGPAPICTPSTLSPTGELCVPQTWMTVTNVITNFGLVQLTSPLSEQNPNPTTATPLSQNVIYGGSLSAGISGKIPLAGQDIAADLSPSATAEVHGEIWLTGTTMIPPQCQATLYFGIRYTMANVMAYSRNGYGQVTSAPALAWAPIDLSYTSGDELPAPAIVAPPNPQCVAASAFHPIVPTMQFLLTAPFGKVPPTNS